VRAHFSAVGIDGLRTLAPGARVSFEVIDLGRPIQDGYRYRAERVILAD
jgi:cold shock CspA family protein